MKNFLLAISIASTFAACSTEAKKELDVKTDLVPVNTAGYAVSNASTDVGAIEAQREYTAPVRQQVITKYITRRSTAPVQKDYTPQAQAPQAQAPATSNTGSSTSSTADTKTAETVPATTSGTSLPGATGTTGAETSTKKKGWSDAAKGAAIGGVAGAIGGAVINGKNRGVGAAIGAVIGAAGGYVIGRKMDKKNDANQYSMVVN